MRRSLLITCSISVLTVAGWTAPVAAQTAPPSAVVRCGQTLTSSVRLANDLMHCRGNGLVIGADNITVDLAGHMISGVNAAGSEGIADDGHRGARIQNGTIERFFRNGVGLRKAPHSAVDNMTIRRIGAGGVEGDASAGVQVQDSPNSSVTASRVTNDVVSWQSDGVDVLSSAGVVVSGNQLARNSWNGMAVVFSPGARVVGNVFDGNKNQGIEVNFGSDRIVLARNHARKNVSNGLVVGAISGALIEDNILTGNTGAGLFMFDLLNSRISGNRAGGNGVGIDLEGGQRVSTGNRIANNDTSTNHQVGLVLGGRANDNVVVDNVANANQGGPNDGGGIVLFDATGNKLRGNVANRNRDVGIGVFEDAPGASNGNVLTANVANFNGNHGIVAVRGTVDGGGNRAHGNTPLPNCLRVVCS